MIIQTVTKPELEIVQPNGVIPNTDPEKRNETDFPMAILIAGNTGGQAKVIAKSGDKETDEVIISVGTCGIPDAPEIRLKQISSTPAFGMSSGDSTGMVGIDIPDAYANGPSIDNINFPYANTGAEVIYDTSDPDPATGERTKTLSQISTKNNLIHISTPDTGGVLVSCYPGTQRGTKAEGKYQYSGQPKSSTLFIKENGALVITKESTEENDTRFEYRLTDVQKQTWQLKEFYREDNGDWILSHFNESSYFVRASGTVVTEYRTLDEDGNVAISEKTYSLDMPFGLVPISREYKVDDYEEKTVFNYNTNPFEPGSYGNLAFVLSSTGSFEKFYYDEEEDTLSVLKTSMDHSLMIGK